MHELFCLSLNYKRQQRLSTQNIYNKPLPNVFSLITMCSAYREDYHAKKAEERKQLKAETKAKNKQ